MVAMGPVKAASGSLSVLIISGNDAIETMALPIACTANHRDFVFKKGFTSLQKSDGVGKCVGQGED
jgi:hypothetical protein